MSEFHIVVKDFPLTASGKILKRELVRQPGIKTSAIVAARR
jgi:hypothetical protein